MEPAPYAASWIPVTISSREILSLTLDESLPEGVYTLRVLLTVPGTSFHAGAAEERSFTLVHP
jgi:hypothetical protein